MSRDTTPGLARLQVQADSDHSLGVNLEVDRVRVGNLAPRNRHRGRAVESKALQGGRIDAIDASFPSSRKSNRGLRDREVTAAEGVGDLEAKPLGTDRQVQGLAKSGIPEGGRTRLRLR